MSTLGFNNRNMEMARPRPPAPPAPTPLPAPATTSTSAISFLPQRVQAAMAVPRGFIPTLLYSGFALTLPILIFYASPDFTSTTTQGITIGASALLALLLVFANDCAVWFNMALFFHTGIEAYVVDTSLRFANAAATSDRNMALAITGAVVVIVHLVPFYLFDRPMLLSLLAFVGVVVNTSIVVYLDPANLLLVGASSSALLALTMMVSAVCEVRVALANLLMKAMKENAYLSCGKFEL